MELFLLNLLILIDCFLCNSYPCVLRNYIFIREICWKFTLFIFWDSEISNEISKFQKSELGKFIPNFPLKHVITGTNNLKINF